MIRLLLLFLLCPITPLVSAAELELITFQKKRLTDSYYSEGANVGDFNKDGVPDIVSGPLWYEGPDFSMTHEIWEPKPFPNDRGYANSFFSFPYDFDRDGWMDLLAWGLPGTPAWIYLNPKEGGGRWEKHEVINFVGNESPDFTDVTGDGIPELICVFEGRVGYASFDPDKPTEKWSFRPCGFGGLGKFMHGMGCGDVNGDGRKDILVVQGWLEQPENLEEKKLWAFHKAPFGRGGAQMFAYDVDGDGDNDVITSLAAHQWGLSWFENTGAKDGEIAFKEHRIMGEKAEENPYGVRFSQLHAVDLEDVDGDGLKDIVTGKCYWAHNGGDPGARDPAVMYYFRLTRKNGKAAFVPHLMDADSGLGRLIETADLNGDGQTDVVTGNKKGVFVFLQERKKTDEAKWKAAQPKLKPGGLDVLEHNGIDADTAARAMTLPDGFHATVAAAEPEVKQPIAMALDDRGRVWVAEGYSYPQRRPEGKGKDRILIFEDKDGDGKFDERKVFAEGLNLVSGIEVGYGGVWVGAAPYLMFIPDRDGDDVPDSKPDILLDGWGYQDTHETLNAFIWGPDGWLYGCHGVFTHSKVGKPGTPDDERTPMNAGIWRYHPVGNDFEVFAWGTSNPWGVDFNDQGHCFLTACVIPHLFHIIQGARYHRQGGQHFNKHVYDDIKTIAEHRHWPGGNPWQANNRSDSFGGGHAHSGAMIYLGGAWPENYRNQIFMNNIHGARLNQDLLVPKGSGYVGKRAPDFLLANDKASQILNFRYGPDGQVYMIDWYDTNQCHSREIDRHDRSNGRIFKVSYGAEKAKPVNLRKATDGQLVEYQLHANDWYVRHARRILAERTAAGNLGKDVHRQLKHILEKKPDATRRLRALWALHVTDGVDVALTLQLLADADAHVRGWAIQLACENPDTVEDAITAEMASLAASDPSPVVRLYLASALQRLDHGDCWRIAGGLVAHGEDAGDHNLPLMIWYGIEPLIPVDPARAMRLAAGVKIPLVKQHILRRMAALPDPTPVLLALKDASSEDERLLILDQVAAAVKGRANLNMPDGWPAIFEKLSASGNVRVRDLALQLTVKFGDRSLFPALREILADKSFPENRRLEALEVLLDGKDATLGPELLGLLGEKPIRLHAIRGLGRYSEAATPVRLLALYPTLSAEEKREAVSVLSGRKAFADALLEAMETGTIEPSDISAFAVRQMMQHGDSGIEARITKAWGGVRGLSEDKASQIADYRQKLTPAFLAKADLPSGRELYDKTCASCHKLFGLGKVIGPDLTGSNRADLGYILENILDPSALIGRDYQMSVVHLKDGRVLAGLVRDENETALTVQLLTEAVVVPKSDIAKREAGVVSMMPEGQLLPLKPEQVRDLVAYLASPTQVPLPGTEPIRFEGESMRMLEKSAGRPRSQPMGSFSKGKWSGNAQIWWTDAKPGDKLTLELPVKRSGEYLLRGVMTKALDYGIHQLWLDGEKLGEPVDLYNRPDVITTGVVPMGIHVLEAGNHRFVVEIAGANEAAAKGYMLGLDYLELVPVK